MLDHTELQVREIPVPGEAVQIAGSYRPLQRAPMIGEHNDDVLVDVLGLDPTTIAQLRADGVVWDVNLRQ